MYEIAARAGLGRWQVWGSAIVASAAVGRWTLLWMLVQMRPVAGRESLSQALGADLKPSDLLAGSFCCLLGAAPFAFSMPKQFLLALALTAPAVAILMQRIQRRLGGLTGDCLGCVCFVTQTLVLLAAAARLE